MTAAAPTRRSSSVLRHEWDLFLAQLRQIRDQVVNYIFALTFERGEWRGRAVTIAFLVLIGLMTLRAHRLPEWGEHIRNVFIYFFNPAAAQSFGTNPLADMLTFALGGWPIVLRYLPVLVLPYLISMHNASRYLADIFEIQIELARTFIWEVALGGGREMARIREGEFMNRDESLIYTIGGPGYVMVEMDSAALFEKPDGTPHVIGPTVNGPARLTGFERFRQAIDLRDQHIRLDDGQDVGERSRDGIIVKAADVHIRFSVDRGGKDKNLRGPHPYRSDQVIEKLIYEEPRSVSKSSSDPSGTGKYHSRSSSLPITSLLRAEFKRFIGERRLTEFLASYSGPEVKRVNDLRNAVEQQKQTLLPDNGSAETAARNERSPKFMARPEVTELFREQFRYLYLEKGLELVWIDVGTWKTPAAIVPEHHFEAWLISTRNAVEGSERAIESFARKAFLEKTIRMIQNIPIERYSKVYKVRSIKHREAVGMLVSGYREQLVEAREFLAKELSKDSAPPELRRNLATLDDAIAYIEEILANSQFHWPRY
ncbi:MAG TPA: hypothetical protein VGJ22_04145 [Anaerolineales bacterium]|jgi:hypothetical protein